LISLFNFFAPSQIPTLLMGHAAAVLPMLPEHFGSIRADRTTYPIMSFDDIHPSGPYVIK